MKNNDFEAWADSIRQILDELASQPSDYPLGSNELREKSASHEGLPAEFEPLYAVSDGMSLPDVHIGYFIDPAHRVSSAAQRGEPTVIEGKSMMPIHVFGSDGGGGRFALGTGDHAVYYLPSSGAVKNGVFVEDEVATVRRVAGSLIDFLWLLKADIEAFVNGHENHVYIAR
jgi:hypothetical protein